MIDSSRVPHFGLFVRPRSRLWPETCKLGRARGSLPGQFSDGASLPANVDCTEPLNQLYASFFFSIEIALLLFFSRTFTSIPVTLRLRP
jgi:hypothetical protein